MAALFYIIAGTVVLTAAGIIEFFYNMFIW